MVSKSEAIHERKVETFLSALNPESTKHLLNYILGATKKEDIIERLNFVQLSVENFARLYPRQFLDSETKTYAYNLDGKQKARIQISTVDEMLEEE